MTSLLPTEQTVRERWNENITLNRGILVVTSDWSAIRSPYDPEGDAGVSVIAVNNSNMVGFDYQVGLQLALHAADEPYRHLLQYPMDELPAQDRDQLLQKLSSDERERSDQKAALEHDTQEFKLERDKSLWNLVKTLIIGFAALLGSAFLFACGVLFWNSLKSGSAIDSGFFSAILSTFADVLKAILPSANS